MCYFEYVTNKKMKKEGKNMSDEKKLEIGNEEVVENTENKEQNVEGYAYCTTHKQKCLNDCAFGGPSISHID